MKDLVFKIKRRDFYLLSAIFVFLIGVGFVIAYGSGDPLVHGHDAGEIESFIGYYVPSEIKATNIGHDGNFGGYLEIYNWIQINDCADYHVCDVSEIARFAQTGGIIPNGWVISATPLGGTSNSECGGFTTDSGRGSYWTGSKPSEEDCDNVYPVLCCK